MASAPEFERNTVSMPYWLDRSVSSCISWVDPGNSGSSTVPLPK